MCVYICDIVGQVVLVVYICCFHISIYSYIYAVYYTHTMYSADTG